MSIPKTTGLTLQEAIQSGKPFTRPLFNDFVRYDGLNTFWLSDGESADFSVSDILATDWIISEPVYQITKQQLAEAWDREIASPEMGQEFAVDSLAFERFCKHLEVSE